MAKKNTIGLWLGLALAAAMLAPSASADPVEDFYKGKTITMLVGFPPGGLNDISARLVARHMVKYIPGTPRQVVQNMPGAGGLTSTNYLYNVAPQDGTYVGGILRSIPQSVYAGDSNARFDPAKFAWLGSTSSFKDDAYAMIIMADRPIKTWEDLKTPGKRVRLGAVGEDIKLAFSLFVKDIMKLNVDVTHGYLGAPQLFLAMQNGEIDGQFNSVTSTKAGQPNLWRDHKFRSLLQFGRTTRLADIPDVPTAREIVKDPSDLALLSFAEAPLYMSLPFAAPPNTPADRVRALRKAFDQTHTDPDFLAEAAKSDLDISPIDGDKVAQLVGEMKTASPDIIEKFKRISTFAH